MTSQYETSWSTHVNIVRLAQPISRYVRWRTQAFKIEGFVLKRFLPSPPSSFIFWLSFHFSRGQNRSFFAPKPNGNACYAGYWDLRKHFWLSSSTGDHCCAYQLTCIMTISTYTTGARAEMTRQLGFALWKSESLHPSCKWSQVLDESQTCLEVRHKWLDLLGKLWIFFRADLPERKRRFPSWAGAEKVAADFNFGEKNGILVAISPGPCQIEVTSLHFVLWKE